MDDLISRQAAIDKDEGMSEQKKAMTPDGYYMQDPDKQGWMFQETQKDRVPLDKQLDKWIVAKNPDYSGGGYYKCPVCNYEYSWGAFFELDEYEYCPKCGALLNGKTKANDCISRQATIDALIAEGRNVDSRYLESERIILEADAVEAISMLPSAQPEIIYCRECKFASGDSRICMKSGYSPIGELDFCAWAERRTDEMH